MRFVRRVTALALPFVMSTVLSGCLYANVAAPIDVDLNESELGAREGESSAYSIFWLLTWGDLSYATAAKNGNITVMKHADIEKQIFLFGLFCRATVRVYGD